jgi:hypothetical protein
VSYYFAGWQLRCATFIPKQRSKSNSSSGDVFLYEACGQQAFESPLEFLMGGTVQHKSPEILLGNRLNFVDHLQHLNSEDRVAVVGDVPEHVNHLVLKLRDKEVGLAEMSLCEDHFIAGGRSEYHCHFVDMGLLSG